MGEVESGWESGEKCLAGLASESIPDEAVHEYCNKNYHQILPIIAKKVHQEKVQQEKLKAVKARLNFEESLRHSESGTPSRRRVLKERLEPRHARSRGTELDSEKHRNKRVSSQNMLARSDGEGSAGGHWKSRLKRQKSSVEDNLSQPWVCEETDPFTPRISYFDFPKTRMPSHIKTYDGSEDPKDHLKIFQATAKTERRKSASEIRLTSTTSSKDMRNPQKNPYEGHTTDECMHLKRQIEEMLKVRKLSHLIKELKQSNGKDQEKAAKKGETSRKDKPLPILMVQPCKRVARQQIIQIFSSESVISFLPLREENGTEGPMIIEVEMGGHCVHHMYVDRGSSSEILYEHCFNRFFLEVVNKKDPGNSIHGLRNVKIPSDGRNGHITEQQDYSALMHNGFMIRDTAACDRLKMAFKQMKRLMAELPMVTAPKEKEELIMYLAATKEVISAVLMTERDGKKLPIYFVRCVLQGPEVNYTPMEKLILALVSASKRLKRPRTSVQGQILIDFITQRPGDDTLDTPIEYPKELPDPWVLFTDRSSCIDGSRAGLIITNPKGMEFTYALRFRFNATNNKAEYKALIAGLWIAEQIGVKNLQANVDLKLVANQINGVYVAKEPGVIKYLEKNKFSQKKKGKQGSSIVKRKVAVRFTAPYQGTHNRNQHPSHPYGHFTNGGIDVARLFPKGQVSNSGNGLFHQMDRSKTCGKYNGSLERENQSLGEGVKARLGEKNKNWVEEISHVLWAHRTMIKSSNRETPFSLTYGTKAVIPVEIKIPTMRTMEVDMIKNEKLWKVRNTSFHLGDLVYWSNEASRGEDGGKLGPKWEGPYEITEALGKGAYKLRDRSGNTLPWTWNICNLKKCYLHEM
nr:reverse transcriptase domain-containing protein [Tanacetum cinerariifolium]